MARFSFPSNNAETTVKAEAAVIPDFLDGTVVDSVEELLIGGFLRLHGNWVYITQLSEEEVVVAATLSLPKFREWLIQAITVGVDGWDATHSWGTRELPEYATAQWASTRFGLTIHPEKEEPPYSAGAFASAWFIVAVLDGGRYPQQEEWGWEHAKKWHTPRDFKDAPLAWKGKPLGLAISSLATKSPEKSQESKANQKPQQQLFKAHSAKKAANDDLPF